MPGATPEATFSAACQAMERLDWGGVFACLDPGEVKRLALNSLSLLLMATGAEADAFVETCARYGVSQAVIAEVRARARAITESAKQPIPPPGPAMLEQSRRHQQIVQAFQQAQVKALDAASDLPAFAGALERLMHADGGGGSVSSALFLGESLENLRVEGTRASGIRRLASGATEDVRFVKRKGVWYIQLFTRRR